MSALCDLENKLFLFTKFKQQKPKLWHIRLDTDIK